ncbi:MAG: TRAP transporter substrate-binding protein DctP [Wenzhouxiangellaceae bacterium]
MKRREMMASAALGAVALAGCQSANQSTTDTSQSQQRYRWKMVTTWPKDFPGMGTGANRLAERITRMSNGRLTVTVYGGNELVPPFETFDAVSRGTAEMGHGASYYWKGKAPAAQYFAGVPFGMTATEVNAWLYYGGGLDLWREVYAPFGVLPFPGGNTGVQMGGWFNREINSLADLQGLKMRIPGLGGEVLQRVGGLPVNIPGAEIFTALKTGTIDATEWVGPWNDLAFGLHQAAEYYYYPGWHEPGTTLECLVNAEAFSSLPDDLQAIVENACMAAHVDMYAEYTMRNQGALQTLVEEHGVQLREFSAEIVEALALASREVLDELAKADEVSAKVYDSYRKFLAQTRQWTSRSELSYLRYREQFKQPQG